MLFDNVVHVAAIATAAVGPSIERRSKRKSFEKDLAAYQADVAKKEKKKKPLQSSAPAIDWDAMNARDDEIARLQKKLGLR